MKWISFEILYTWWEIYRVQISDYDFFRILFNISQTASSAETHLWAPLYLLVLHALELGEGLYRPPWKLVEVQEKQDQTLNQNWRLLWLQYRRLLCNTHAWHLSNVTIWYNLTSTLWHLCIRHIRRLWSSWWLTSLLVLCRTRRRRTLLGLKFVWREKDILLMYVSWHGHNDHKYHPDRSPSWKRDHNIESHTNGPLALDRMRVACIRGWRSSKMLWSEKAPFHIASPCPRIPAKVYKWVWESEMVKDESFGKMRMNALWYCGCHGGSNQYIYIYINILYKNLIW